MADKSAKDKLPVEFWTQPETLLTDPAIQLIYSEVTARLRAELDEVTGAGVLEQMQAERVSTLYCYIRQKENKHQFFANDRAYKETMQLWFQVAGDLQKAKHRPVDPDEVRLQIVSHIAGVLDEVLVDVSPAVAMKLRTALAERLESA